MANHTSDLIIQVTVGMWQELTDRIATLEAAQLEPALAGYQEMGSIDKSSKARTRGTRLPEGWIPTDESVDKMVDELGTSKGALVREHRKFCDHFYSAPAQRGVKVDWDRAWRNWMRRASEQGSLRSSARTSPNDDKIRELMEMNVHGEGE